MCPQMRENVHIMISAIARSRECEANRSLRNKYNDFSTCLAEGVGFDPTVPLRARRFSRPVP